MKVVLLQFIALAEGQHICFEFKMSTDCFLRAGICSTFFRMFKHVKFLPSDNLSAQNVIVTLSTLLYISQGFPSVMSDQTLWLSG